ncbi:MAG: ATP-dependent protease ATPase subunit HslU [Spirochaetales bacterium]|nr:ATP-dependent protease ATPase subunit HslU [Spirochaetales bacterium]
MDLDNLTPKEIVKQLDTYIIGQEKAKKAVAIALRNRTRRKQLPEELREEIAPKNIIMMGSTGVGKTEIARRLSRLCGAPFIKVEATKYTEVGYVGRDVESMVRDLMHVAVSMVKEEMLKGVEEKAEERMEEVILDLLLPGTGPAPGSLKAVENESHNPTREKFRQMLREGKLDDREIEVNVTQSNMPQIEIFSGASFEEMGLNMGNLGNIFGGKKKKKRVKVKNARELIKNEEMEKLIDQDRVNEVARERTEQMGIIFIDEIDKVASKENRMGADVSREGVQRDILPIVEGSKVNTKFGMIDTSHILFIAAGAFHSAKPSDLIPELQGRFPIRVELQDLGADEFFQILTQPKNALIVQYRELLQTEGVTLDFTPEANRRIAEIAEKVNTTTENIGARRLHTVMELLLEDVSFNAPDLQGQTIKITPQYVNERLNDVVEDQDLSRFIL